MSTRRSLIGTLLQEQAADLAPESVATARGWFGPTPRCKSAFVVEPSEPNPCTCPDVNGYGAGHEPDCEYSEWGR